MAEDEPLIVERVLLATPDAAWDQAVRRAAVIACGMGSGGTTSSRYRPVGRFGLRLPRGGRRRGRVWHLR